VRVAALYGDLKLLESVQLLERMVTASAITAAPTEPEFWNVDALNAFSAASLLVSLPVAFVLV